MLALHGWWRVEFYEGPHWNRKYNFNLWYENVKIIKLQTEYTLIYEYTIIYAGKTNSGDTEKYAIVKDL
jgi:hypothetical protein